MEWDGSHIQKIFKAIVEINENGKTIRVPGCKKVCVGIKDEIFACVTCKLHGVYNCLSQRFTPDTEQTIDKNLFSEDPREKKSDWDAST